MKRPNIKDLTLREKIAQLCIVRQSDLFMYEDSAYTKFRTVEEARELVKKNQYGGIWIHGGVDVNQINSFWRENVKFDTKSLMDWYKEVRKDAKIPIIAANDAAGKGACTDLGRFTIGLAMGASSYEDASFEVGQSIGRELSLYGIDWVWSPICDLVHRRVSGIVRQYANNADDIIRCATGYMKGLQSMNVSATAKHFPGSDGKELRDSHIVTTNMNISMEDWWKDQGRIFQALIDAGVDAIMNSARTFPAADDTMVDGRYLPAGLSYKILTKLLKEKMGFKGVIITDDVNMGGYTSYYNGGKLYAEFIKAGNDMLLGVGVDAVDLIEEEVKKGTVSVERIDDAVERVLDMKEKRGLFTDGYRNPEYSAEEATKITSEVNRKVAETSVTLVRDRINAVPYDKEKIKKVAIITYAHIPLVNMLEPMKEEFEKHGAEVLLRTRLENFDEAKRIADEYDLIVYAGFIGFHSPKGAPSFYGDEFWSLRHAFVYGTEKSVGVSLGYPHIMYDFMDDAHVFVNTYNTSPEMQVAFVKGLYGDIPFVGKSPVELD